MESLGEIKQCNIFMQVVMYAFTDLFNYQAFLSLNEFWHERRSRHCLADQAEYIRRVDRLEQVIDNAIAQGLARIFKVAKTGNNHNFDRQICQLHLFTDL